MPRLLSEPTVSAIGPIALLLLGSIGGCGDNAQPAPPPDPPPPAEAVSASFRVAIDTAHPDLSAETIEPRSEPATVTSMEDSAEVSAAQASSPTPFDDDGEAGGLDLHVAVKRVAPQWQQIWFHLLIENQGDQALRDIKVDIDYAGTLYHVTRDPFAVATAERSFVLGGIGPRGIGMLSFAVPTTDAEDAADVEFDVSIAGYRTQHRAANSSTISITPDGGEVWAPFADADTVAVIDTTSDERVAQVPVPGKPTGVAITPDGQRVLVTSATGNTVSIIDRESRTVIQTLDEDDGIGREPRHIVMSPDGDRAYISAYVDDTITALDRRDDGTFAVADAIAVGRRPLGMALTPDGQSLYVAHFLPRGPVLDNEGWITVIDTEPLSAQSEVPIHDYFNEKPAACFQPLFGDQFDAMSFVGEGVPTQLAGVFLNPGGNQAWIPHTRLPSLGIFEFGPNAQPISTSSALRPGEIASAFISLLDTRRADDVDLQLSPGLLDAPGADPTFLSCMKFATEIELLDADILTDPDQQINRGIFVGTHVAGLNSLGLVRHIAYTRGGRRMMLLSHQSDEIALYDAVTHHPLSRSHFQLSGANPSGMVVSPDGAKAYVAYENSTFVSVLDLGAFSDTDNLPTPTFIPYQFKQTPEFPAPPGILGNSGRLVRHIGEVPQEPAISEITQVAIVDEDPMDPLIRRGRILFNSSNPDRYSHINSRVGTCSSCHPDGGSDGSIWATMEGERRTMSLRGGVAGRGWLHISGTHQDAEEFVAQVTAERLGGNPDEDDLHALTEYVAFGIAELQKPSLDAALVAQGKEVFEARCGSCHVGDDYGSGNPSADDVYGGGADEGPMLFDVGTATDDAHSLRGPFFSSRLPELDRQIDVLLRGDRDLGDGDLVQEVLDFRPRPNRKRGEFRAPSMVDIHDYAVFFHDASVESLEEAVAYMSDRVGGLSADEQKAVVEFLKSL